MLVRILLWLGLVEPIAQAPPEKTELKMETPIAYPGEWLHAIFTPNELRKR